MNGEKSRSIFLSCEGGSVTRCINRISKQSINESFHRIHQNTKIKEHKNSGHPQQHWRVVQLPQTPHFKPQTKHRSSYELPQLLGEKKSPWRFAVHVLLHFMRPQLQTNFQQQIFPQVEAMVSCVSQRSTRGKQEKKKQPLMTNVQLYI